MSGKPIPPNRRWLNEQGHARASPRPSRRTSPGTGNEFRYSLHIAPGRDGHAWLFFEQGTNRCTIYIDPSQIGQASLEEQLRRLLRQNRISDPMAEQLLHSVLRYFEACSRWTALSEQHSRLTRRESIWQMSLAQRVLWGVIQVALIITLSWGTRQLFERMSSDMEPRQTRTGTSSAVSFEEIRPFIGEEIAQSEAEHPPSESVREAHSHGEVEPSSKHLDNPSTEHDHLRDVDDADSLDVSSSVGTEHGE